MNMSVEHWWSDTYGGIRRYEGKKTCCSATLLHRKIDTFLQFIADVRYQFSGERGFAYKSYGKYYFIYKERDISLI